MAINLEHIEKHLKEDDIILLVLSRTDYSKNVMDILKIVAEKNNSICYVSVNKPEATLVKAITKNDIDLKNFLIIDSITPVTQQARQKSKSTVFTNSPTALTSLSIAVDEALKNGVDNVFVDAVSTFMAYNNVFTVVKFAHNLISKIRTYEKKGVFIVLKEDVSNSLFDDLCMFVDNVIEVSN